MERHRPARRPDRPAGPVRTRMALSQNFLRRTAVVQRLVDVAEVRAGDTVVEVGPGAGIITQELADRGVDVVAYEKDPRFARRIRSRFAGDPRVTCVDADFRTAAPLDHPFHVVANVPFSITTDVVRWCLDAGHLESATLITQEEFARKHTGAYGTFSRLAVTHWPEVELRFHGTIARHEFEPAPSVNGAILRLRRRSEPLVPHRLLGDYREMVEIGFTGVGGSLVASLRRHVARRRLDEAARAADIGPDLVVGFVRPDQWITLYAHLSS